MLPRGGIGFQQAPTPGGVFEDASPPDGNISIVNALEDSIRNTALFQAEILSKRFAVLFSDLMSGPLSESGRGPAFTHPHFIIC
jgi:hypothetical protein